MRWEIKFKPKAAKDFSKLDRTVQLRITRYLHERAVVDPKAYAEPLKGRFKSLWRYRVGDYRIVVDIREEELVIAVLRAAKRGAVYETEL